MKPGAIIPSNVASLRSLTVTMAVMCYLACLAIGALILVDRAVTSWTSGLSREMTVQVRVVRDVDVAQEVEKARAIVAAFPGIVEAEVLDERIMCRPSHPGSLSLATARCVNQPRDPGHAFESPTGMPKSTAQICDPDRHVEFSANP